MIEWADVVEAIDRVPTGAWVLITVANVVLIVVTWAAAGRRLRRAGRLTAGRPAAPGRFDAAADPVAAANPPSRAGGVSVKDAALTAAAVVPAILFWVMVLAGSFHGLVAFGRDTLGWRDGWEYLVPGTLDGVSVTFAFLAFRAIRRQKSPARCQRVVWGAAVASATVNFAYEYADSGHNAVAGGYLALLSLFGMVMFHEFLNQFEEGTGYVRRDNPAFGLRWLTWPTNTFCAAVAWRNHPPVEGTVATVREAVANLDRVRTMKRAARQVRAEARHEKALAARRRKAELTSGRNGPPVGSGEADAARSALVPITPPPTIIDVPAQERGVATGQAGPSAARLPATAPTVAQWIATWIAMCADGDLVLGPLNDNDLARSRYGLSAKQLRNIRNAATSGALRRRAQELGIRLPSAYTDSSAGFRINGRAVAT
jgi:hypothetical protein